MVAHHGRDFSSSLQEVDDLALVSWFHTGEQAGLTDGLGLILDAKVIKFATSESLAFG
jgi:hypothetical protein